MRILTREEMMAVSGSGRLDAEYSGSRSTDFGSSRGPASRSRGSNDGRNAAMDSYLGKDVYGANNVGLNTDVGWGGLMGALSGALGGVKGAAWGAAIGVLGASRGGLTSPSPSNNSGRNKGDGGGRGDR